MRYFAFADRKDEEAPAKRLRQHDDSEDAVIPIRGKPFIPGERRSMRNAHSDHAETFSVDDDAESSTSASRDRVPPDIILSGSDAAKSKGTKGYAFVLEERPIGELSPKGRQDSLERQAVAKPGGRPIEDGDERALDGAYQNSDPAIVLMQPNKSTQNLPPEPKVRAESIGA